MIDTPIVARELLPTSQENSSSAEDILGDYALHDFFLYHLMDSGVGREAEDAGHAGVSWRTAKRAWRPS